MASKQGWLHKKGAIMTGWKKRWVEVSDGTLRYLDKQGGSEKGSFAVGPGLKVEAAGTGKKPHAFEFNVQAVGAPRVFHFAAGTAAERDEWVAFLSDLAGLPPKAAVSSAPASSDTAVKAKTPEPAKKAEQPAKKAEEAAKKAEEPAKKAEEPAKKAEAKPKAEEKPAAAETAAKSDGGPTREPALSDGTTPTSAWNAHREEVAAVKTDTETPAREAGIMKTIRVFVSSTFVDEHGERDELVRRVFAELNTQFRSRWVQVVPVDLRWGVSAEQTSVIQQTCLNEIDNCRVSPDEAPWFIGLRGERYGWVQEKYDAADAYIHPENFGWLDKLQTRAPISITSLEVYHATLGCRRSAEHAKKGPHALMLFRDNGFKSKVPSDMQWLFDFEYKEEDATVPEAVQFQYTKTSRAKAFEQDLADLNKQLQEAPDVCTFAPYYPTFGEPEDGSKVEKTGQLPTGKMFGVGYVGGLSDFGKAAYDFLYNQIDKEYPELPEGTPLEVERVQHKAVIISRSENFLGREELLASLSAYVEGNAQTPLVVFGRPGCGKSALMATFCRKFDASKQKGTVFLSHIVGATGASQTLRGTLQRFVGELKEALKLKDEIPFRTDELKTLFFSILEKLDKNRDVKKLVIVIDAVNQMLSNDDAHKLAWLPFPLPAKVKIIVSTLPEENNCLEHLRARRPAVEEMEVPLLNKDDREELVSKSLAKYHKKLTTDDSDRFLGNQMALLMAKEESGSPLYLVAAVEELRTFAVYEQMTAFLSKELPGTVLGLFSHLLDRLEHDHGRELVEKALGLIAVSRSGLFEIEMIEMLRLVEWSEEPISNFSRLYAGIKLFVSTGGSGLMQFFHQQLLRVVRQRYLHSAELEHEAHSLTAAYFRSKVNPKNDDSWDGDYPRGFEGLCYHLMHAGEWSQLESTLCSLRFIERRCAATSAYDLVSDYVAAKAQDTQRQLSPVFGEFSRFVLANSHILAPHPEQAVALAAARAPTSAVCKAVYDMELTHPFLQCVNRPESTETPLTLSIAPGTAEDGRAGYCHFSPDSRLLAATFRGSESSCKIYDPTTGNVVQALVEHTRDVYQCQFFPCGTKIAVAMKFKRNEGVGIFDVTSGDPIIELEDKSSTIDPFEVSPDGTMIVGLDSWGKVILWKTDQTQPIAKNESTKMSHVSWLSPSEILCLSSDDQFIVYDLQLKQVKRSILQGQQVRNHTGHLKVSPTHKFLAYSGHKQRNGLGVLDLTTNEIIVTDEYSAFVIGSHHSFSADESLLAVATISNDAALSEVVLYDLNGKQKIGVVKADISAAKSISISSDGSRIALVGREGVTRVFDVELLKQAANAEAAPKIPGYTPTTHESELESLFYNPEGDTIVSTAVDMNAASASSGRALFWDAETGTYLTRHPMNVREGRLFGVSRTNPWLLAKIDGTGYKEGREYYLHVLEHPDLSMRAKVLIGPYPGEENMLAPPESVWFSPDQKRAFVSIKRWFKTGDEVIEYDLESGKELRRFSNGATKDHEDNVHTEVSPDMSKVVVIFKQAFVLLDIDGKELHRDAKGRDNVYSYTSTSFFPDSNRIAMAGNTYNNEGVVMIFDAAAKSFVGSKMLDGSASILSCHVSSDGAFIATASETAVAVFDVATTSLVARFMEGNAVLVQVSPKRSAEGSLQLAAGYKNGDMKVMRLITGKEQLVDDAALAARKAAVIDAHTKKKATSAGVAVHNTVDVKDVPAGDGGSLVFQIDGVEVVPTTDKVFYKTKWTPPNSIMSELPEFLIPEWPSSLGTCSTLTFSLCAIKDGQPDYSTLYMPTTGAMMTPGKPFQFVAGQIMRTGTTTEMGVERIPTGEYLVMVIAQGSSGTDQKYIAVSVP